jgi:hypothetical protein
MQSLAVPIGMLALFLILKLEQFVKDLNPNK